MKSFEYFFTYYRYCTDEALLDGKNSLAVSRSLEGRSLSNQMMKAENEDCMIFQRKIWLKNSVCLAQ